MSMCVEAMHDFIGSIPNFDFCIPKEMAVKMSTLFGRTLREAPGEAEQIGYQLVLRAGLARQTQAGSFALLPLGLRVLRRIEAIMHEELARIGAQEFRTPIIQSAAGWERSGRYDEYGPLMLRFLDRAGHPLIVAPTHEEAVAELAAREITSYRQLGQIVYQIHTKYRDEARAKGGLMRMREFTMLDAYSLDADTAGLDASYAALAEAFERVFERSGLQFVAVEASAGEMGGGEPREYMALSESGEDMLALCAACGYAANVEVAQSRPQDERRTTNDEGPFRPSSNVHHPIQEVATPNTTTIASLATFLNVPESATAKAVFFDTPERGLVFAVIRGDLEVNEAKLRVAAGVSVLSPATTEQIVAVGAVAGYASPVGLKIVATETTETTENGWQNQSSVSFVSSVAESSVFVVADRSVVDAGPLVAGANRVGYHLQNVVYGRDWQATLVADVAAVREGDACMNCGAPLRFERGVEVGHIFKLGTRFTTPLGARFLDPSGREQPLVMGSYGIGLERVLQVLVEQHHDERGIVWPSAVAPLDVHLVRLGKSESVTKAAEAVYGELAEAGLRVLYDDRDETAGVKFNDADLIGLPLRVVVSERLLASDQVEIKPRVGEAQKIERSLLIETVRSQLALA